MSDPDINSLILSGDSRKKRKKYLLPWHFWSFNLLLLLSSLQEFECSQLRVTPLATQLTAVSGLNTSLACSASAKPILCLWKTPYGHVYTLSEGVFAESGRLRHEQPRDFGGDGCGLQIVGVESRDQGDWHCEVGGIVNDAFETNTATISLEVRGKSDSFQDHTSRQEVGNDVILHCSSDREVHLCRWKTPYLNTYIVGEGIYVERGRIQWLGKDPNYDCTIRVAKLDLRDAGTWVCEIGSTTSDTFQVQTKEFVIDIETPLKLSAPTSLMQNANTDATLVCHANKPYDECLWTTPYGETYSFSGPDVSHENGRIGYFGFASTDCGIIVHNVEPKDNGDWLCQLHSKNGNIFQNATDIVPLFADLASSAKPRAIPDYDYDKKLLEDDYEEFSDFSKLGNEPAAAQQSPPTRVQLLQGSTNKNNEEKNHQTSTSTTKNDGIFGQQIELTKILPSKITTSTPASTLRTTTRFSPIDSSTTVAAPLSVFRDSSGVQLSGVNALELELLSRISGTRRDSRPVRIGSGLNSEIDDVNFAVEFESSRTDLPVINDQSVEKTLQVEVVQDQGDRMRLLEIQRIRDERRKMAAQRDSLESAEPNDEDVLKLKQEKEREEEKMRQQEIERKRAEERLRLLEEKRKKEEEEQKKKEEEERKRIEEEKRKEEEEEKRREAIEKARQEEKRRREEIERKRFEQRQKQLEEQRKKEEEEKKRREEEEKKKREEEEAKKRAQKEQEEREREAERLRQLSLARELERKRILAEKQKELEEQKKKEEEEKRQKELEEQRKREEERKQKELEEKKKREEEEKKQRQEQERLEAERKRQQQIEEERKKKREEELRQKLEEERRKKIEEEKRKAEMERKRLMEIEKARKEEEEKRKAEEERLRKEIEQKKREEEEKERQEAARKKKEEEERRKLREETARREEERRRRLEQQQKREEEEKNAKAERQRRIEEEERKKELEKQRREEMLRKQREEERQRALERKRLEERERELQDRRLEDTTRKSVNTESSTVGEVESNPRPTASVQASTPKSGAAESSRSIQITQPLTNLLPEKPRESDRKQCVMPAFPSNGNVTCGDLVPVDGEYHLIYGQSCVLTCKAGFVSLELRESRCFNGKMTQRLECVLPDAMLIVGGRSDTYGVLNSVELVTGRGVCRGAVPPLPAMRWRMIAHAIDRERVLACGGVNIFGDPKADCWIMGFNPEPFWSEAPRMNVARDAAAWAQEGNFLFVMGGSLGKFSGFTDSVEMYSVESGAWLEGPKMSNSRYSHCAVGLGNGSLVVTGGYGGLNMVERLDISTATWHSLPELNPVRAQHGCALVDLHGEQGIIVVGGDSGGTRLNDVRFLPLGRKNLEWRKVSDMQTARWGRPGVGIVGGRITVAAGWNGVKDLDTIEYYDEVRREWRRQASRLQTERRWPSSTPISLSLFPKCAQRRE